MTVSRTYTINISGDIKTITGFEAYGNEKLNSIHFGGLVNLRNVEMAWFVFATETINLSRNRQLEHVNFLDLQGTKDILLPTNNVIRSIGITGVQQLPTAVVDRLISRIYDSVKNAPRTGDFSLAKHPSIEDPAEGNPLRC